MNDTTLTQLKILVERAVRPVRASVARKRKMREELLAHVIGVFQEEAKLGDESAALERTAQRFGPTAELTQQLQAAVPASGAASWFIEALIGFPPRESTLRLAARHAVLAGALFTAALALMIVVIGRWSEWLTLARLPALLTPVYFTPMVFCATVLAQSMRQALFDPRGWNWPRIIATGVAAWLLVPALTFAWSFAFTGDVVASLADVAPLLLTGVLAPALLLVVVGAINSELRHHEEWAALKID